jgi:hypothetical protein
MGAYHLFLNIFSMAHLKVGTHNFSFCSIFSYLVHVLITWLVIVITNQCNANAEFPGYHTALDSYNWMEKHGDPLFLRHLASK